jgi:hypothetical protein
MVRQRILRAAVIAAFLALAWGMAGIGGPQEGRPERRRPVPVTVTPPPVNVKACANGTVASYLESVPYCSQGGTVYHWLSYSCTSTPASICASLGTNGSKLAIQMDPQGPYTLLVGRTSLWNVTAGQSVDVAIHGTVYGALSNGSWPHFKLSNGEAGPPGQTGDGTEENITTVACGAQCTSANHGVSDILCSATSPVANCTEQETMGPYETYQANFVAAPAAKPYALTIEIKLNGNHGTASLFSVGTHLIPVSHPE